MQLERDQLNLLFSKYLKEHFLRRSCKHDPIYESVRGGSILTNRLILMCKDPRVRAIPLGKTISAQYLFNLGYEFFERHNSIFLYGLNYSFTKEDLDDLLDVYNKTFTI